MPMKAWLQSFKSLRYLKLQRETLHWVSRWKSFPVLQLKKEIHSRAALAWIASKWKFPLCLAPKKIWFKIKWALLCNKLQANHIFRFKQNWSKAPQNGNFRLMGFTPQENAVLTILTKRFNLDKMDKTQQTVSRRSERFVCTVITEFPSSASSDSNYGNSEECCSWMTPPSLKMPADSFKLCRLMQL